MNQHINQSAFEAKCEKTNVFPNPDVALLERFASVVFKHADRKGFVSLRAFPHKEGEPPPIFKENITLDNPQFSCRGGRTRPASGHLARDGRL